VGLLGLLRKGRSQDSRLERHAGYEQYRGMAAHLAGNGGLRRRYGLPYAPSKSPLHAMAASVAAAGKAFMGAVPAATVVSRKDNGSSRQPLPRHMRHGHLIHDLLSILVTTCQDATRGGCAGHQISADARPRQRRSGRGGRRRRSGKATPNGWGAPMTRRNNFNTLQKRKRKGKTYWASILASQSGSSLGVPPDVSAVTC